tara:strand:+ start:244 stop:381 length:138 start_codon:yes stop_codon:yes gene_type:complete
MATKTADGSSLQDYKKIKELIDVTNKDFVAEVIKQALNYLEKAFI